MSARDRIDDALRRIDPEKLKRSRMRVMLGTVDDETRNMFRVFSEAFHVPNDATVSYGMYLMLRQISGWLAEEDGECDG